MIRKAGAPAIGLAAIAALVLIVNPRSLGAALSHLNLIVLPLGLILIAVFYLLQGLRWHFLLRETGSRLEVGDSLLLNMGGQAVTAILPLGDLTRAALYSEATGAEFGAAAATVTVQELSYTLILVLVAAPALLEFHLGVPALAATLAGVLAVLAILSVSPVFHAVNGTLARLPILSPLAPHVEALRRQTVGLLRRPRTLAGSLLDLTRAATMVSLLWLILHGLRPGAIGWEDAALVLAVSYVGGAVSLIPGGAGANEASVVGMLVLLGLDPAAAGAAALLQRVLVTGVATLAGLAAYGAARRRFHLAGLRLFEGDRPQSPRRERGGWQKVA
ncbi:MAG: lysylphosphatidylglycerol synthase transmembrane domain-containing protein [Candidatus Dormibacteraceae bacterium]